MCLKSVNGNDDHLIYQSLKRKSSVLLILIRGQHFNKSLHQICFIIDFTL